MKRLFLVLMLASFLQAQSKTGTAGTVFLKIPVVPRFAALGAAGVAVANDASSVFLNPAGLAHVKSKALFTAYTNWVASTSIPAFSFAFPLKTGAVVALFSSGVQARDFVESVMYEDGTIEFTGNTFDYNAGQLGLTFAQFLTDKFATGVSVKFLYEGFGGYSSAKGFALDAGTVFYTGLKSLRVAMSLQNLGPDMKPSGEYIHYVLQGSDIVKEKRTYRAYKLPLVFRIGVAADLMDSPVQKLTVVAEGINANDTDERLALGLEHTWNQMLNLRVGFLFNKDEGGASFGIGFHTNRFQLDYSFNDFGHLTDVHRIALNFNL